MKCVVYKFLSQGLRVFSIGLFVVLIDSCNGPSVNANVDTVSSGVINISVDETFKPVIDSEIKVFEALYPNAKIIAHYKPEADCLKDLIKDSSTRLVIVTRGLSDAEEKFFKDTLQYVPVFDEVADDAIAVIVNNKSADSFLTMEKIRGILDGSTGDKEKAVFDGTSATSTVRYAVDSILHGEPLNNNKVIGVVNSQAVIDYVSAHNDVIGFVGVSWIGNKDDTTQLSFLKKVKIASVECSACGSNIFVKPYQANIIYKRYPLVRGLYYILKENYEGLGSGFTNFLGLERGQLIFQRDYLGPVKMDFSVREATSN